MNAIPAAVSHEKLQGLGKQHLQGLVREWYNPSLVENPSQALFEGIGLHPGAVTGYLIFQPENIAYLRSILGQDIDRGNGTLGPVTSILLDLFGAATGKGKWNVA